MATTTRLTELQSLLLSHASRNDRYAFDPLPERLVTQEARVRPCLRSLVKRGLAEVHIAQTEDDGPATEEIRATSTGLEVIGCVLAEGTEAANQAVSPAPHLGEGAGAEPLGSHAPSTASPVMPGGRAAQLLELLGREEGATVADLVSATGTLPHSVRAALTGLRKKGHAIASTKVDGDRRYSVAPGA